MLRSKAAEESVSLVGDARWRAFKTAFFDLIVRRRGEPDAPRLGDEYDGAFVDALSALEPSPALRALAESGVFDAGHDVGRRVYARRTLEDTLAPAVAALSRGLESSRVGRIDVVDAFHRAAAVSFTPHERARDADRGVLDAFVGGVIVGFVSEALNTDLDFEVVQPLTYRIRLGAGRDVNRAPGIARVRVDGGDEA